MNVLELQYNWPEISELRRKRFDVTRIYSINSRADSGRPCKPCGNILHNEFNVPLLKHNIIITSFRSSAPSSDESAAMLYSTSIVMSRLDNLGVKLCMVVRDRGVHTPRLVAPYSWTANAVYTETYLLWEVVWIERFVCNFVEFEVKNKARRYLEFCWHKFN